MLKPKSICIKDRRSNLAVRKHLKVRGWQRCHPRRWYSPLRKHSSCPHSKRLSRQRGELTHLRTKMASAMWASKWDPFQTSIILSQWLTNITLQVLKVRSSWSRRAWRVQEIINNQRHLVRGSSHSLKEPHIREYLRVLVAWKRIAREPPHHTMLHIRLKRPIVRKTSFKWSRTKYSIVTRIIPSLMTVANHTVPE